MFGCIYARLTVRASTSICVELTERVGDRFAEKIIDRKRPRGVKMGGSQTTMCTCTVYLSIWWRDSYVWRPGVLWAPMDCIHICIVLLNWDLFTQGQGLVTFFSNVRMRARAVVARSPRTSRGTNHRASRHSIAQNIQEQVWAVGTTAGAGATAQNNTVRTTTSVIKAEKFCKQPWACATTLTVQ